MKTPVVTISRKAAWLLIVASAWTLYVWISRVINIAKQVQTTAFKSVHFVLAGISIAFAIAIARIAIRALRGPGDAAERI